MDSQIRHQCHRVVAGLDPAAFHPQAEPFRDPRHRGAGNVAVNPLMVTDNPRQDLPVLGAGLFPIHASSLSEFPPTRRANIAKGYRIKTRFPAVPPDPGPMVFKLSGSAVFAAQPFGLLSS